MIRPTLFLCTYAILSFSAQENNASLRVLFFGDSITAGYGVDPSQAFPSRIEDKVQQLGWPVEIIAAGLSGETSAGGLRRIDWVMRQPIDVMVLELGANDGLRGISPEATEENLRAIIAKVRAKNPDVAILLAGMMVPPNLGEPYSRAFSAIFPRIAEQTQVELIPFILEGVAGESDLNQSDGIHPTSEGHRIIARSLWSQLESILRDRLDQRALR